MGYAWGSHSAIAALQGRAPSEKPEAELWMGAHPMAPSKLARTGRSLLEAIDEAPRELLGPATVDTFGPRLPFLLKVLAAAQPLSLQAHPTMERARAGFADEEARGIPRDAPHRNYKDASHKPELLCTLTPFQALCGFRAIADTLRLFDELAVRALDPVLAPLRNGGDLGATFRAIMTLDRAQGKPIVDAVVSACRRHKGAFAREAALAQRLAELYPGDVGIVSALLLNLLELLPGQAIYLGAGNLHAYLEGTGVEIMASSDNVLRGGLTPKHVDVPELMAVLDFTAGPVTPITPRAIDAHEAVYDTPAREFRLSRIDVKATAIERHARAPEILLVVDGAVDIGGDRLKKGEAAFIPGTGAAYRIASPGPAILYRATTNTD